MAYFTLNQDVQLYYEVHGDPNGKETIAFLNGVMASVSSWSMLWPVFERAGFRVIVHDFKGQLKSSKPKGPYTFEEHCAEAKALFEHLGVGCFKPKQPSDPWRALSMGKFCLR